MTPFVATHISAMIESIRLLEMLVTTPLGLYSDIKMLRESLSFPEAVNLSRDEIRERRTAYTMPTDQRLELALTTISSVNTCLDALNTIGNHTDAKCLAIEWIARARSVLSRAEQQVAADIRVVTSSRIRGLYVIVDPEATNGRPVMDIAGATLKGGASVVQLRDKSHDKGEILPIATGLKSLCEEYGALFIMNDDADLGVSVGSHGIHIGQSDLPIQHVRPILQPTQIIGRSNNTIEEALEAQAHGADYLAIGAIYETSTMGKSSRTAVGVELVAKLKEFVSQPVVAIGGINAGNISGVIESGADCVCVVSAVTLSEDPESSTRALVQLIERDK